MAMDHLCCGICYKKFCQQNIRGGFNCGCVTKEKCLRGCVHYCVSCIKRLPRHVCPLCKKKIKYRQVFKLPGTTHREALIKLNQLLVQFSRRRSTRNTGNAVFILEKPPKPTYVNAWPATHTFYWRHINSNTQASVGVWLSGSAVQVRSIVSSEERGGCELGDTTRNFSAVQRRNSESLCIR